MIYFFYPPTALEWTHTTPIYRLTLTSLWSLNSTCLTHLARVSPPQTSSPLTLTQWNLPDGTKWRTCRASMVYWSFRLAHSSRKESTHHLCDHCGPKWCSEWCPFYTHTHSHTHAEVKKKKTPPPYGRSTWVRGRKWEGVKKKRPSGGELVSAGSLCLWSRQHR